MAINLKIELPETKTRFDRNLRLTTDKLDRYFTLLYYFYLQYRFHKFEGIETRLKLFFVKSEHHNNEICNQNNVSLSYNIRKANE